MKNPRSLSAVAALFLACGVFAGEPNPPAGAQSGFAAALHDSLVKIGRAYIAGKPVDEAWPQDEQQRVVKFAASAADYKKLEDLKAQIASAKLVQQSQPPIEGPVFEKLVRAAAAGLSLDKKDEEEAVEFYVRRLKGLPPASKEQLARQKAAAEALMANPHVPAGMQVAVKTRMDRMAAALGRGQLLDAPNGGAVTAAMGSGRPMTAEELRRLNALPAAQRPTSAGRTGAPPAPASTPPPKPAPAPLTAEQREQRAIARIDQHIKDNPNTVDDAYKFWDDVDKDKKNHWWITRAYAKVNKGLLSFSGVKDTADSYQRYYNYAMDSDVSGKTTAWQATKFAGNAALTTATFLPAASFAESVRAGEGLTWAAKSGTKVAGMAKATPKVAEAMTGAAKEANAAVRTVIPEGEALARKQLPKIIEALDQAGSKVKIAVQQGGTIGESVAQEGRITANLTIGGPHETIHAFQQLVADSAALRQEAATLGKSVEALSAAERTTALARSKAWLTASTPMLEGQAGSATGFMGEAWFMKGKYAERMARYGYDITRSMAKGEVLTTQVGGISKFYGTLPYVIGTDQAMILRNLGGPTAQAVKQIYTSQSGN